MCYYFAAIAKKPTETNPVGTRYRRQNSGPDAKSSPGRLLLPGPLDVIGSGQREQLVEVVVRRRKQRCGVRRLVRHDEQAQQGVPSGPGWTDQDTTATLDRSGRHLQQLAVYARGHITRRQHRPGPDGIRCHIRGSVSDIFVPVSGCAGNGPSH